MVLQAVLQVVVICFAGFICAYEGLLPKSSQKVVSHLNVNLFTPCLIFSKLSRTLSIDKILEISIIPIFFILSTFICYFSGSLMSFLLNLDKDETNFVIANSIFGNSNSLPVSLTISLAYTLPNLTWDDIPNDTRGNVASRGLLYLVIFQQFGQMLRWSWGYNTLLKWPQENLQTALPQHTPSRYPTRIYANATSGNAIRSSLRSLRSSILSIEEEDIQYYSGDFLDSIYDEDDEDNFVIYHLFNGDRFTGERPTSSDVDESNDLINLEPSNHAATINKWVKQTITAIKNQLNPPLYSMLLGILVASIPPIHKKINQEESFINNTFTEAIDQLGSVSIPLILIVLGSNLYPSEETSPPTINHNKIVFGSIVGRMIIPPLLLLPMIAILVKYIQKSILDDPIFLIVGFILTVSPPAIQLTQITQLNDFFEVEMTDILFWSYVVLSLPVSILTVSVSIYVLQWANPPS